MKMGMRKPSIRKSIAARNIGRAKSAIKRAVIPGYGRRGMGWITNPGGPPITEFIEKPHLEA